MTTTTTSPVVRAVTVGTSPERAFAIFTDRIGAWWPLAMYSIGGARADVAFVDGQLRETTADGSTAVWGEVTEWDPPRRVAFSWAPGGGPATAIEVDFEAADGETRVVLTHRGWEALGEDAERSRGGYDSPQGWNWVLSLYRAAAGGAGDGAAAAKASYDVQALRHGYEAVADALTPGTFADPPTGEWNARQVAGHVITNAELMVRVLEDVRRGAPARLNGPDDHAPEAVGRCDELTFEAAVNQVRKSGAELVARCAALSDADLETSVSTYIEHHGDPVVDGEMTVGDLLAAEVGYHLPAHEAQIKDLLV